VVHDGEPILLDANKTPSASPALRAFLQAGMRNLAEGIQEMIAAGQPAKG
jgi:Flp pilus assembly protein CpaB